jgi:hypothetical protein
MYPVLILTHVSDFLDTSGVGVTGIFGKPYNFGGEIVYLLSK